jgi:hypothetical protein
MANTDLDRPCGPEGAPPAPPLQFPCRMGTLASKWQPLLVGGCTLFTTSHPVGGLRVRSTLRREAPIQESDRSYRWREAAIQKNTEATFR